MVQEMTLQVYSLETDITTICQNSCAGCDHLIPLETKRWSMETEDFRRDIDNLKSVVHSQKYGILGGEPTLHPRLLDFIQILKDARITDRIQLWTNGQTFDTLDESIIASVKEIVWGRYPGKVTESGKQRVKELCSRHGVTFSELDRSEFFKIPLYAQTATPGDTLQRFNTCGLKKCGCVVQSGYIYLCCVGPSIDKRLLKLPPGTDGVPLEGITEEKFIQFVNSPEPLIACSRCQAYHGRQFRWHEVKGAKAWLAESME